MSSVMFRPRLNVTPIPTRNKNVVLIGAKNGYGKYLLRVLEECGQAD